jgi:hypothetical protein
MSQSLSVITTNDIVVDDTDDQLKKRQMLLKERAEYSWLLSHQSDFVLEKVERLLNDCCRRLPMATKLSDDLRLPTYLQQPEKLMLVSRANDAVRCTMTLLGENVVQTDIAIRYAKAPGGFFRAVAQPDIQVAFGWMESWHKWRGSKI